MVTTRRQTRKRTSDAADTVDGSSFLESPAPAATTTTQSPKRQRKLPVRAKSGKAAAAADDDDENPSEKPLAPAPEESSLVVEIRAHSASDEEDVLSIADDEAPEDQQPAPVPEIEEPSSQPNPTAFAGTKKTFGDDDDVIAEVEDGDDAAGEKITIAPSISEPSSGNDSDSDSDDEAPEAVSTSKAAVQAIQSAKAANKAIADQAKAQKRKRQERTARLQSQAQARKPPTTPGGAAEAPSGDEDTPMKDLDEITPRTQLHLESAAAFRKSHPNAKSPSVPALLPDSYLASDDEDDGDDAGLAGDSEAAASRPRKARKLTTADRQATRESRRAAAPAPDRVVGTTLYRAAAKKRDERLAPRSGKSSANTKRDLLIRGRQATQAKKGFFVK